MRAERPDEDEDNEAPVASDGENGGRAEGEDVFDLSTAKSLLLKPELGSTPAVCGRQRSTLNDDLECMSVPISASGVGADIGCVVSEFW